MFVQKLIAGYLGLFKRYESKQYPGARHLSSIFAQACKKESCITSPRRFFRALALHATKGHGQKLLQAPTTRLSVPRLLQWQLRRPWWSLRWSWVPGLRRRTRAPSLRRWSREPRQKRATTKSSAAAGAKAS